MALDRQSIEKKDFPIGRRGYDPEAVDSHLSGLADEIAEFKRSSRRRSDALASSASDQVRAIVEAAERTATEIQTEAEGAAREIREEAAAESAAMREQTSSQVTEYVNKISAATAATLQRVEAMESELSAMIEALRTGGERLTDDLRQLESHVADVSQAISPRYGFEREDSEGAAGPPWEAEPAGAELTAASGGTLAPEPAEGADAAAEGDGDERAAEPPAAAEPAAEAPAADEAGSEVPAGEPDGESPAVESGAGGVSEDAEGARLIALNMALNGTPRDETARYLSENFTLADSDRLLDEVYASVGG